VSFLERLRDFLRHPVLISDTDRMRYQRRFLAVLERCEAAAVNPDWLRHQQLVLGENLAEFTDTLAADLVARGIPAADVPTLVDTGIAIALEQDEQAPNAIRTSILRSAVERAMPYPTIGRPWENVSRYAREIQAVRQQDDAVTITGIGRICLALTGREAVKWLLHVEVALSTGLYDPWRLDRHTLHTISRASSEPLPEASPEPRPILNYEALDRWIALGVLHRQATPSGSWRHAVDPSAQPIIDELAAESDTPMSILVQALLEDEVRDLLPEKQAAPATTATIRQARLIVHEIGHTVTPIQVALESIARTARAASITGKIADPLRRANQALDRLRSFSNKLDELAQLAGEIPDIFDAESALREALRLGRPETGHVPTSAMPERLPRLKGVRSRFVLGIVNVLHNAYQAAPADAPAVAMTVEAQETHLSITIDDNGPGVAPTQREVIFLDGYSTRGSSGRGLALARATIEHDMNGSLTCEDGSLLGGARFVIVVPIQEERTP
jgi:signal transduction histidine kinase